MAANVALLTREDAPNVATLERAATPVAPTITTSALPGGRIGVAYDQVVQATGTPSPTLSITDGELPPGLSVNAATRRITGTPTAPSVGEFTATVTNSAGSASKALSILVPNEAILEGGAIELPAVTTVTLVPSLANVLPGQTTDLLLTVEDQSGSPIANLLGTLTVSDASATAEQLAITDALGQAVIRVTGDGAGSCDVSVSIDGVASNASTVTVLDAVAPTITTETLPDALIGQAYLAILEADGSTPRTWSLDSGSLPAGFSLSASGTISGTGAAGAVAVFTVKATNDYGSDTQALTLTVREEIAVTSVTVTPETVTIAPGAQTQFSAVVAGAGAFSPNVTWSVVSGGGSISSGGVYTAPAAAASVTVRATSVTDPTKYDEATVTVEVPATTDSIRVPGIRCGLYQGSTLLMPIRITMTTGSAEGQTITAASSDPEKVAVSPSAAVTDADGKATFTLSFVAGGQSTITFASGAMSSEMLAITRVGGNQ